MYNITGPLFERNFLDRCAVEEYHPLTLRDRLASHDLACEDIQKSCLAAATTRKYRVKYTGKNIPHYCEYYSKIYLGP